MENVAFSDLVRDIIHTSGKLAAQFGYDYVDSEHLLLAIIDESLKDPKGGGVVLKTFKQLDVDIFQLIECIERTFDSTKRRLSLKRFH
ncbi:MAG TPA: Clp protease N-terminal domain-containing protein [Mucilaginibacter sp.]